MRKFILISVMLIAGWTMVNNPFSHTYVTGLKTGTLAVTGNKNSLMSEIEMKAKEYEIEPSDARKDPVWKVIPGYNGLKVDVKKSFSKMEKEGEFDPEKLVFKQVPPEIHLSDLPPMAIYKGHPEKPMVSFIINVAWGNEYLSGMLATLKKHNVTASFFLEGRWVKNNPGMAKMIADAGHEIGNHSFTHPNMKQLSAPKINEEIRRTNEVIEAVTGVKTKWFAPPSGYYKDEVVEIAAAHKLGTVMWSVDTIDWQKPSPEKLINRVMGKVHNGAMILMHPTESTAASLDQLITQIKGKDLQIGTVSNMLSENRIVSAKKMKE
ncbi:polysaccharide deacetylase family protein [Mesobacillus selenatarsenatis]|uniref:Polysaccharide deacetylase, putative n=1 Tax=Mesobacillus selenatarsenatis (strain DSM 18680 / JCM 14380 / FERM P-15431 / SF-1) TaxID=1321606 RepID=A0A0A8XBL0_MESS1|nr:polysaccharide deacetylase family protein [Mesobacillus selenatarsenatis]GAM15556.1 polysaccharide deacetylase, putative [Mesobacillus selenatarsenatis SF-1]